MSFSQPPVSAEPSTRPAREDDADALADLVNSDARGQGVGSALLQTAEAWSRRQGFGSIRVRSNVIRAEAHEFYRKRGYSQSKQQAAFDKDLRHD